MDLSFLLEWHYVKLLLEGLLTTIILAMIAVFLGFIIAIGISILRISSNKVVRGILTGYVELLRGTPLVVQLILFYSLFHLPVILVGGMDISPFIPGTFTLFINSSAYLAEVMRAGIQAVDQGQWEASFSLGMPHNKTFFKIIFPQAVRNILPALGNEFVTLIKETSILMYSGVAELTYQATLVKTQTYSLMGSYFVAAMAYFLLTYPTSLLLKRLERRLKNNES